MKIVKAVMISALVSTLSLFAAAHSAENSGTEGGQSMPMTQGQQGNMPMMQGQQGNMPMMQGQQGNMPMMQGQHGNMPMMQMMQMMQQRHAVMDVHMNKMETHLLNIEKLLKQLVELQKDK